jgi:hypothetical protein
MHLEYYDDEQLRRWLAGRFHGKVAVLDPDDFHRVHYVQIE